MLTGRAADGSTVSTPQWNQLLVYEHSIRKKAFHIVQTEGKTFKAAMVESYRCAVTKERFFTTPVALASVSKRPLNFQDLGNPKKWRGKGEGKGKAVAARVRAKEKEVAKAVKAARAAKVVKARARAKVVEARAFATPSTTPGNVALAPTALSSTLATAVEANIQFSSALTPRLLRAARRRAPAVFDNQHTLNLCMTQIYW